MILRNITTIARDIDALGMTIDAGADVDLLVSYSLSEIMLSAYSELVQKIEGGIFLVVKNGNLLSKQDSLGYIDGLNERAEGGADTVRIWEPQVIPRIVYLQSGTFDNPRALMLAPDYGLFSHTGPGELRWIHIAGNRDEYEVLITVDDIPTILHARFLRDRHGLNTDTMEDAAPPIYSKGSGGSYHVLFRPAKAWKFNSSLRVIARKTKNKSVGIYGAMEVAI